MAGRVKGLFQWCHLRRARTGLGIWSAKSCGYSRWGWGQNLRGEGTENCLVCRTQDFLQISESLSVSSALKSPVVLHLQTHNKHGRQICENL